MGLQVLFHEKPFAGINGSGTFTCKLDLTVCSTMWNQGRVERRVLEFTLLFHRTCAIQGKHANWSVGTDTGLNFFYPGKTEDCNLCQSFVLGMSMALIHRDYACGP